LPREDEAALRESGTIITVSSSTATSSSFPGEGEAFSKTSEVSFAGEEQAAFSSSCCDEDETGRTSSSKPCSFAAEGASVCMTSFADGVACADDADKCGFGVFCGEGISAMISFVGDGDGFFVFAGEGVSTSVSGSRFSSASVLGDAKPCCSASPLGLEAGFGFASASFRFAVALRLRGRGCFAGSCTTSFASFDPVPLRCRAK